jgi:hypothetical protein
MIKDIPQSNFNQIKGTVYEVVDHIEFPSITLEVGNNTKRFVNFYVRKTYYDENINVFKLGIRLVVTFFISSRKKHERWYTTVNILRADIE